MEQVVIELTINKWMLYVIVVSLFLSFISNMLTFYNAYLRKKLRDERDEAVVSDERIQQVIDCLDGFGRQTHSVEYGLPVEKKGEEMHSMVKAILNNR